MHFVYLYNYGLYCKSYANSSGWFAYSTYSGLTITGVVLFALLKYNQVPNIYGIIGIVLIIIGVVMVNYLGRIN